MNAGRLNPRGFTLLELIISIGVLMLLVSIAMPAISKVRRSAENAQSMAAMRQLMVALDGYTTDHQMRYPYFATPGRPQASITLHGVDLFDAPLGGYFLQQSVYWASLVLPYLSADPKTSGFPTFVPVFGQDKRVVWCRYMMTHTAFASPAYWRGAEAPDDLSLLQGTRVSQVRNPARKGILLDIAAGAWSPRHENTDTIFVAFGDSSVRPCDWHPQASYVSRPFSATAFPIMSTEGGLEGVDY